MKPEDIFNAITNIRDDQIEFAKPHRSRRWYAVPIAACLALALIALPFLRTLSPRVQPLYTGTAQLAAANLPRTPGLGDDGPYLDDSIYVGDFLESIEPARAEYYRNREVYNDRLSSFWAQSAETFLTADHEQNLIFSPVSLYTILGMSAELCEGSARQEILDLLHSSGIDDLRQSARQMWCASYSPDGDESTCILANSLWLSNAVDYNQPVLDTLAESYFADSFRGDMGSPEYDARHLEWLDEKSNGYLTDKLPELKTPENTLIYLDSTLYYKAGWYDGFDPSNNVDGDFHATYMDQPCTFMRESFSGLYYRGNNFTAVSKDLYGGQRMLFVLPDKGTATNELLADGDYHRFISAASSDLSGWENTGYAAINLSVPKFDITSDMDMIRGLKEMGINGIFESGNSSFAPLTSQDFAFTTVSHTCRIAVDEEGCEGAAVTVMRGEGGASPAEELDFTLDRPFLFSIISDDGLPIYMGVVNRMSE